MSSLYGRNPEQQTTSTAKAKCAPFSRGVLQKEIVRISLSRMERVVSRAYVYQDTATVTPQQLVNIRPVVA